MANVLLIILLIISIILIGLILIQRSEGGALGIGGGGGGGGGLMSGRGTASMVTKLTTFFGIAFMVVCVLISISFNYQDRDASLFDGDKAVDGIVKEQETEIPPLPLDADTGNDTAPLAEDSNPEESDAQPQDKPQEDPQD